MNNNCLTLFYVIAYHGVQLYVMLLQLFQLANISILPKLFSGFKQCFKGFFPSDVDGQLLEIKSLLVLFY